MAKLSYKLSYYALYALIAISLIVFAMFFFGGDAQGDAYIASIESGMWQPAHTDAVLYLNYGLFALATVATIVSFVHFLICNPKASIGSLYVLAASVLIIFVTWFMGSPERLEIVGYEGTDNVGFWAQATDMFLYSLYALLTVAVVCMLLGGVKKRLS